MQIKPITIGRLVTKNNVFLAPLAGYSDFAFRQICLECGAGLTFTEMVSAKGLVYGSKNTAALLKCAPSEELGIRAVQLFGSEPEIFERALKTDELKKFDIIDINMGCPVPKVFNNGEGSALMNNLPLAKKLLSVLVKSGKAVTVKMRTGVTDDNPTCVELAKICEGEGVSLVTLHARSREHYYSGEPNIKLLEAVRAAIKIPLIANGNVFSETDAELLMSTGADGVMLARGAMFDPTIFSTLTHIAPPSKSELYIKQINLLRETDMPEKVISAYIRKQLAAYLHGVRNGKVVKQKIFDTLSLDTIIELIRETFE